MKVVPDTGRVRVSLGADASGATLSVEDDGPGVPPALREAIFERFRRGDDASTRRFGGTGLGLTIVREIIERHGGRITIGDGIDGGARFTVYLPATPVPAIVVMLSRLSPASVDFRLRRNVDGQRNSAAQLSRGSAV
jgi:signal transduction histidine kinase